MAFHKTYVILEIPEFKGMNLTNKFNKIKITGIETEKPIVRLDNFVFQGKWYSSNNSIFYSIYKNPENIKIKKEKFFSFLELKSKNKKNSKFLSNLSHSNQFGFFLKKRLRLFRISMGLFKK